MLVILVIISLSIEYGHSLFTIERAKLDKIYKLDQEDSELDCTEYNAVISKGGKYCECEQEHPTVQHADNNIPRCGGKWPCIILYTRKNQYSPPPLPSL